MTEKGLLHQPLKKKEKKENMQSHAIGAIAATKAAKASRQIEAKNPTLFFWYPRRVLIHAQLANFQQKKLVLTTTLHYEDHGWMAPIV